MTQPAAKPRLADPEIADARNRTEFYAQMIAKHTMESIAILGADNKIEWANDVFLRETGYTLREVIGRSPNEMLGGPETDRAVLREIRKAAAEKRPSTHELQQYRKSGESYWIEVRMMPVLTETGALSHTLVYGHDISERKALERDGELARQKELLRQAERRILSKTTEWLYAARSLDDLYNVVERCAPKLMPGSSGALYIYSNSRDVLDLAVGWGETTSDSFIEPDECWALRRGRAYHFGIEEIEFPCGHYHDDVSSAFCLPLLAHGETIGMLWCRGEETSDHEALQHARYWELALMLAEQISLTIANVRLRQELQDRSIKDPLTGLWNRRYFLDTLRREKGRADSSEIGFALISIDIDHFKKFNDHHGHDAGDLVLRRVATELVETAGAAGIVCRVGGEELAVICPDLSEADAMDLAHNLQSAVKRAEIVYQGEILPSVTFSAGVSTYPSDHSSIDDLMRNADNALYKAKRAGRDRVIAFDKKDDQGWVLARKAAESKA